MSDHFWPATYPVARKAHRCIACNSPIPVGEKYVQQTGHYDGSAYRNRFHNECWDELREAGEFEFFPGELDPPARLQGASSL